jgi:hypothetical protein
MVKIQKLVYQNEHGEEITIDFAETDIEYRVDRVTDLVRDMAAGGRDLGPPPRQKPEGEQSAWIGG